MTARRLVLSPDDIHVWRWRRHSASGSSGRTVRDVLALYAGRTLFAADFSHGRHGKPFLPGTATAVPVEFNLSHSDDITVMAVSRLPVGIDVEKKKPLPDLGSLAEYCLTAAEASHLAEIEKAECTDYFYRCWTRKEAYLKGCGRGLTVEPHRVDTTRGSLTDIATTSPCSDVGSTWHFHDLPGLHGCAAVVATPIQAPRIAWFDEPIDLRAASGPKVMSGA